MAAGVGVINCGLLGVQRVLAEGWLGGYGFAPREWPDLVSELEIAMAEAALEAGYQVLRERGLGGVLDGQDPPATAPYALEVRDGDL